VASVWWQLRKRSERPRAQRLAQIDSHIRQIAKAVQDLFEAVDELFSIYSRAYERLNASGLHAQSVRFGHAVVLSEAEWSAVSHALSEMTKQYSLVRIHCMSLQRLLPLSSLPGRGKHPRKSGGPERRFERCSLRKRHLRGGDAKTASTKGQSRRVPPRDKGADQPIRLYLKLGHSV